MRTVAIPTFRNKCISNLETLHQISERTDIFKFSKLDESKQMQILKGCIKKYRFSCINEVAQHLVFKYDNEAITLNFYGCRFCGGYHVTKVNQSRREQIEKMIINLKNNIAEKQL